MWATLAKSRVFVLSCYIIGLTLIGYVTLAPRPANQSPMKWTRTQNSLFVSLSRPAFLIGLILCMLPMFLDRANMIKNFFSAVWWVPLSKLTYLCYLIFPVINAVMMSSMSASLYLSYMTIFALLWFNFVFCMVAAFFLHIFLEGPLMNLMLSKQLAAKEMSEKNEKVMLYYLEHQDAITERSQRSRSRNTMSHVGESERALSQLSNVHS